MNDLEKYFEQNTGREIFKWMHYFDVYDTHFSRFRDKDIVILEIGIFKGGSLRMWKNYFGSKAKIYGLDIDPKCEQFKEENIEILIGSQSDRKFLQNVIKTIPKIDILIDDGGHEMKQQIISFEELYGHIKDDGVYLCEDVHTSYWGLYGGGYKKKGTFIEYSKNLIDSLNAYHSRSKRLKVNEFTRSANSIHFYDSMVVVEKRRRDNPPNARVTGKDEGISTTPYSDSFESYITKYFGNTALFKAAKKGVVGDIIRKIKQYKSK